MATWELVGVGQVAPGGERLARVRCAGDRREGWTWVGGPPAGASRPAGTEPGSEMTADSRVWGSRADAELRCHLGLLDDSGRVTDP
jgi:hypothetical protein